MIKKIIPLCALVLVVSLSGCVTRGDIAPVGDSIAVTGPVNPPAGVHEEIWEEPMTDVVDVPPGLDPEGHYYRPGHQEVVEIRQGRWRYHRDGASR